MPGPLFVPNRRLFLGTLGASLFTVRGLFADELLRPLPSPKVRSIPTRCRWIRTTI